MKKTSHLLIPYFHFGKFAPDAGQIINATVGDFCRFLENHPRLGDLLVFLVKLRELDPERVRFARRLFWFYRLNRFGVGVDDVFRFPFEKFHSLVPFVYVVWVLTKKYAGKKTGTLECASPLNVFTEMTHIISHVKPII